MQGKVKLTKRQVKEDKFTTFMLVSKDKLQSEFEQKWQYYVIGFVTVVLLVWAGVWYFENRLSQGTEAAEAFSNATLKYQIGNNEEAILDFAQVMEKYGGTDFAPRAAFMLGNLNLSARNYSESARYYQMYLDDFVGTPLDRAASYAGIAATQEDQAQYAEAAASFLKAIETLPGGPLEPDYELGAIRNYLAAGNLEPAKARLAILEEKYAESDWADRAALMIAEKSQTE
jgi:TolA-binding protein